MSEGIVLPTLALLLIAGLAAIALWDERTTGEPSSLLMLMALLALPALGLGGAVILQGSLLTGAILLVCASLALLVSFWMRGAHFLSPIALSAALVVLSLGIFGIS